jgi:hypothetical protein
MQNEDLLKVIDELSKALQRVTCHCSPKLNASLEGRLKEAISKLKI